MARESDHPEPERTDFTEEKSPSTATGSSSEKKGKERHKLTTRSSLYIPQEVTPDPSNQEHWDKMRFQLTDAVLEKMVADMRVHHEKIGTDNPELAAVQDYAHDLV
ncbi:hypothetical protein MMC14_007055 [Varicellaria rhodocarpa]|nr:hypothetical protein [Varicellaria rhodocarpa]